MATYSGGSWTSLSLATNQRRPGNNPWTKEEFATEFPEKSADDWLDYFPVSSGGFNFITNDSRYESWTAGTDPDGDNWPQWTLKTDNSEWADEYPNNLTTKQTYYVAYNKNTGQYTGGVGTTKSEAGITNVEGVKGVTVTVDYSSGEPTYTDGDGNTWKGFGEFLQNQEHNGTPLSGGGDSGAKEALQGYRDTLKNNYNANESAEDNRTAAMNTWNYNNVWVPASEYAESHNSAGTTFRTNAANTYNTNLNADDGPRQQAADDKNAYGQQEYELNSGLNKWSSDSVSWAENTTTGLYTSNRAEIFSPTGRAAQLSDLVDKGLLSADDAASMLDGLKQAYGSYYVDDRVSMWDGDKDGGTYDLIGQFDVNYYLGEYGDSRGLNTAWTNATQYGDPNEPYDPDNDLDITARYGSLNNMAWHDYSTDGQSSGARGSAASATTEADEYEESYASLTDAEKETIRDQIFGLTGEGETIDWAENILEPLEDETVSFLEGKVSEVFGEKDLEQQDKFGGLAQSVLRTTIDELRKQQQKEREMDIFRGLPGFSEVYGAGKELATSLLGDSGIGGYLGMMGVNTQSLETSLTEQFEGLTGISNNNAEYNWTKWMDETLKPYYENLEEIEGERVDEDGNKIIYDLTTEEGKVFIDKFIAEYITPRFNMSKSMSEFVSYLDTLDEDEQNIFQTQTAMNKLKQTAEISAKAQFNALKESSDLSTFDADYYFDPTKTLENVSEQDLENNYMNVQATMEKYVKQRDNVNRDWAAAKADGKSKVGIPEHASAYNWEQWAYFYGADINNKSEFAKLHYQVAGQGQYDPAKDIVSYDTMNSYFNDVLIPLVAEEKLSLDDAAFMQFVTPEEFATEILEGIDPTENKEEWKEVLEQFGIEDMDASLEEVKEYIKEAFETGEAQAIREGIKYLNQKKQTIDQSTLGVDYIERDPKEILGEKGDIEEGSQAWKDLMISYNFDQNLTYEQATNAIRDIEYVEDQTTNPIYEIFKQQGYAGTEDEFYNQLFPDATNEELADLNFVGTALQGGMSLSSISSDPFMAMSQFEGFLGGTEGDLYGIEDDDAGDVDNTSYFDLFPGEQDYATDTGRGIIDSWTGGLFG
jgi:hypothetical protein